MSARDIDERRDLLSHTLSKLNSPCRWLDEIVVQRRLRNSRLRCRSRGGGMLLALWSVALLLTLLSAELCCHVALMDDAVTLDPMPSRRIVRAGERFD
jgi:hypothetical protein